MHHNQKHNVRVFPGNIAVKLSILQSQCHNSMFLPEYFTKAYVIASKKADCSIYNILQFNTVSLYQWGVTAITCRGFTSQTEYLWWEFWLFTAIWWLYWRLYTNDLYTVLFLWLRWNWRYLIKHWGPLHSPLICSHIWKCINIHCVCY